MSTYPIAEARGQLGELARRAAQHERVVLTDRGTPTAVLVSASDLEDLEDALTLARLELQRALGQGRPGIPWSEARSMLLDAAAQAEQELEA
ncbi:type II toxin-antitoxin system Phd/YefM family antitoxin [Streptomyces sp. YIM 121038]|uniref:type II toxin-antitoxin system Phd/YefM family antitoxin n=1 Tax=Streptomyces sp. YIM 121038 TaxID=2136401 RepID=UPI001110C32B|nr:type II toxin-antitoxin system Phd/YefM family antitoxin [Streptomyces sp. YIM 121038]